MSVYVCSCGRKTTDPYIWSGQFFCVVCMEDIKPSIVSARERRNIRLFNVKPAFKPSRQQHDFGKHRP